MKETIADIIQLHLEGSSLTTAQEQQLREWIRASGENQEALKLLQDPAFLQASVQQWENYDASQQAGWERMSGQIFSKARVSVLRRFRWVAAAAVLLAVVATVFLLVNRKEDNKQASASIDLPPGKTGAILTLSDGRTILLSSSGNGRIAQENGTSISLRNNQLTYSNSTTPNSRQKTKNTLTTPAGYQFTLVLPDGSKVWLNAGSSITYPSVFTGASRTVKVTGELYMEIAKNSTAPFMVDINGKSTVQVLGTSFNMNAYADDGYIRTTLIEGSIKLLAETAAVILKPGEQASLRNQAKEPIAVTAAVDINHVLAWKNGYFSFNNLALKEVARQIERWYDIQVKFEGNTGNLSLSGEMDRGVSLSGIQRFLKQYGFTTNLQNRTLTITKR